jgi:hypothetical protein
MRRRDTVPIRMLQTMYIKWVRAQGVGVGSANGLFADVSLPQLLKRMLVVGDPYRATRGLLTLQVFNF